MESLGTVKLLNPFPLKEGCRGMSGDANFLFSHFLMVNLVTTFPNTLLHSRETLAVRNQSFPWQNLTCEKFTNF